MKTKLFIFTLLVAVSFCATAYAGTTKALAITQKPPEHVEKKAAPGTKPAGVKTIDNFQRYQDGKFPKWWKTWPLQRGDAQQVYRVKVEGGKHYLAAHDDKDLSEQIMNVFVWNTDEYPYLNWRWRPRTLPTGAKESVDTLNDSACGIYVVFGRYSGIASKYVWSTSLPKGTIVSRRDGNLRILSMGSGQGGVGKWHSYSVNALQSAEKLFGKPMTRKPTGIGILTDGNATHTAAACDYADFAISKKPLY